ncbi:IncA family protein [Chlamydia gallinacea]|uniref:IncA family protein n=1 Tax=Chlamydia gallinacea TaxID=1457153 RepID=UPI001C82FCDA|nr:IncA family protein [Chlamydia gallinacea]MBX6687836.1 IncA family protein [Chlamydia gallinacea]
MGLPTSPSSLQQHEAVQKLSILNKVYKECQLNQSIVCITIIVIGIICILSGIVLTSLSFILVFSLLPAQLSVFLGAILIGVGSALVAFGITKYFSKPQSTEQDQLLAEELLKTKLIAEEKKEEVLRLKTQLGETQVTLCNQTEDLKNQLEEARTQCANLLVEREEAQKIVQTSQNEVSQLQNALEQAKLDSEQKAAKIGELEIVVKNQQVITEAIASDLDTVVSSQRNTIAQKDQQLTALKQQVQNLTLQLLSSSSSSSTTLSLKTRFLESSFVRRLSMGSSGGRSPLRSIDSLSSSDSDERLSPQQREEIKESDGEGEETCSSSDSNLS